MSKYDDKFTKFVRNPVKLNILDRNGTVTEKIVFIGNGIPDNVKQVLIKTQNQTRITKSSENILQGFYGKKWKSVLSIGYGGGAVDDEEEPESDNEEEPESDNEEEPRDDNEKENETKEEEPEADNKKEREKVFTNDIFDNAELFDENILDKNTLVSLEEIYLMDKGPDKTPNKENSQTTDKKPKKTDTAVSKHIVKYIFDELSVYPFDKISEFKKKISVVTSIPIYKQNIWYMHDNKKYNLNYNVFLQNSVVNLSIVDNIINGKEIDLIDNIPVSINFYNVRNLIKVKQYDSFSILENIINLGVSEFNLFNLDDFVYSDDVLARKYVDKNQLDIIYYGLIVLYWPMMSLLTWTDYTNNTVEDFEKMYPELSSYKETTQKVFKSESILTNTALGLYYDTANKQLKKSIEKNLFIGITESSITVQSFYDQGIINIRNLFDLIELDKTMVSCKCSLLYKGNNIILNKVYNDNSKIPYVIATNTIVIKIYVDVSTILYIYIYGNGNIVIKSKWSEDKLYTFADIFAIVSKYVNVVIKYINNMGNNVISSNYKLDNMTLKNSKFSDIYLSLIYRTPIKLYEFKIIENILKEYSDADIIKVNEINNETNTLEYYFSKGMYKFDESRIEKDIILDNYYNYLTNPLIKSKWENFYINTRKTTFQYRHGDIKISIEGVKEREYEVFYMYILNIFAMLSINKTPIPKKTTTIAIKKSVRTLKYQDPLLYDFKKIYKNSTIYSRICQKQNQPIIISNEEFDMLDKDKKDMVVKYWNFTTKLPAYYQCPNPKYPYLQFTVNKHPNQYCIPCCKVKPIQDKFNEDGTINEDENVKQLIYNQCLNYHTYEKNKGNVISDTRYIMLYGKDIPPNRISNLPDETVAPLLYESFLDINTTMSTTQCNKQFYLYGVNQGFRQLKNVGFITSLALSLDMSIEKLMARIIKLIKKSPHHFKTLLDGKIITYFKSVTELLNRIEETFINDYNPIFDNVSNSTPWNLIFIDIAFIYMSIISVVFNDISTPANENIKLLLTNKLVDTQLRNPIYKCLFLIKRKKLYNPIYRINIAIFFRTKIIDQKLYNGTDAIIDIIIKIKEFSSSLDTKTDITLDLYDKFTRASKKYSIVKYFVNKHNLCYYIEIANKSDKTNKIYIPVKYSKYFSDENIDYNQFIIKKHTVSFKVLNAFIKDFNHWVALESEKQGSMKQMSEGFLPLEQRVEPIYNYIRVDKWLYLNNIWDKSSSGKIIGFIHNNVNYYHQPQSYEYIKKLSNAPLEIILYHPDDINTNLLQQKIISDPRVKNITKNIYNFYLYELLILEFTTLLNKEKNIQLRHLIKKQILKSIDKDLEVTINYINKVITDYNTKSKYLYNTANNINDINNNIAADSSKLTHQINDYIINHRDKKLLLSHIDTTIYLFDMIKINSFRNMSKKELMLELTRISKRIVTIVKESDVNKILAHLDEFPNLFSSCQDQLSDMVYCKKNKLIITSANLLNLINIMASDILNPFKNKWMFNVVFTDNIIRFLKFIKRPNEYISIETV